MAGLRHRLHGVDLAAGVLERQLAAHDAVHVLRAADRRGQGSIQLLHVQHSYAQQEAFSLRGTRLAR